MICAHFTTFYLNKIVNNQLQSVIFNFDFVTRAPTFNITNYIPYAVRLEDQDLISYNNLSIFELSSKYIFISRDQGSKIISLNLSLCNSSKFPSSYKKYFDLYNLETAYCIDFDDNPKLNNSLIINGSLEEQSMNYLRFDVSLCTNKINKCISNKTYIRENLFYNPLEFSFFSFEDNLLQNNYNSPSEKIIKKTISGLNVNSRKYYRSMLTNTNLLSKVGLITDSMNSTNLLSKCGGISII